LASRAFSSGPPFFRSIRHRRRAAACTSSVMTGIFVWAGLTKIPDPAGFAGIVAAYQLLPQGWALPVAYLLPWLELFCGLALITGLAARGAIIWVSLQLVLFLAALGINLARGLEVDCGCFGFEDGGGGTRAAFLRDLLYLPLVAGGWWAVFRGRWRWGVER